MNRLTAALGAATALVVTGLAPAGAAVITANTADATYSTPRTNGPTYDAGTSGTAGITLQNASTVDTTLQVGATSGNASLATAVIPFQLPTLAAGETFTTASLAVTQTSASNAQQVDLYGLGRRAAAAAQPADYYVGTTGGDATDATLVQAAFVGTGDTFAANGVTSTSAAGNAALVAYLNAQYAGGAGAGQYVFLRLNVTNAFTTTNTRLNPGAADIGTPAQRPTITYTSAAVPEPAAAGLLGVAAAGLLAGRRRRSSAA